MMRITIHIGTYKTATSAIQFGLARSPTVLSRVNAKYAESGLNVPLSKHLHLFDRIIDGGYNRQRHVAHRDEPYIEQLIHELEDPAVDHLFISEEELSYPSPAVAEYFAPLRAVADVEVLMVVRRQPEFLESLYLQFIKEPLRSVTATFPEFLAHPDYVSRGDFFGLLEPWRDVFGEDAISVMDFQDLVDGDVVVNFADYVGLPRNLAAPDHLINPSVTPAAGELLRLIGYFNPDFPRMQLAAMLGDIKPGPGTTLLTPDLVASVLDTYRDSNKLLQERYGVDLDRDLPSSKRVLDAAELQHLALEAASQVIGVMWQRSRRAANAIRQISNQEEMALEVLRGLLRSGDDL